VTRSHIRDTIVRMARTRIKICGVTRTQDATAAARAGADAIGINFYPKARRSISVERAREILREVPAFVTAVGLFVDQSVREMKTITGAVGISTLQLHGNESPEIVDELREFRVLKVLRSERGKLEVELERWRGAIRSLDLIHLQGLVLETAAAAGIGGTGVENDWEFLAELSRAGAFVGLPPIIVAGGLTPENVGRVVKLIAPYAVDVSSGVEEKFGEKSAGKMEAFVGAVARG
jgi:phosphoribosylanthranilate isomerase